MQKKWGKSAITLLLDISADSLHLMLSVKWFTVKGGFMVNPVFFKTCRFASKF